MRQDSIISTEEQNRAKQCNTSVLNSSTNFSKSLLFGFGSAVCFSLEQKRDFSGSQRNTHILYGSSTLQSRTEDSIAGSKAYETPCCQKFLYNPPKQIFFRLCNVWKALTKWNLPATDLCFRHQTLHNATVINVFTQHWVPTQHFHWTSCILLVLIRSITTSTLHITLSHRCSNRLNRIPSVLPLYPTGLCGGGASWNYQNIVWRWVV